MTEIKKSDGVKKAVAMLDFSCWVAKYQVEMGRCYIFEHPYHAKSWHRPVVQTLMRGNSMMSAFDQCMVGLCTSSGQLMQKRTKLLSNVSAVRVLLNGRYCDKSHKHAQVQGSENGEKRSTQSQRYPLEMCQAIAKAVQMEIS